MRAWTILVPFTPNSELRTPNFLAQSRRGGQSLLEYVTWFTVVAAVLMGIAIYTVRGLSGRWRQVGDSFSQGRQYEPGKTTVIVQ